MPLSRIQVIDCAQEYVSLRAPDCENGLVQVHWKEIEPIAGQGRDAAASFASQRRGEARTAESDTRKRQAARLEEARIGIAKLSDTPSADLPAASRALVTGCIVDAEGGFALDLLSLSSEEGGLAEALSECLPLLAARCIASELRQVVPLALERLQGCADAASGNAGLHRQALSRAESMNGERREAMKGDRARATISSKLLDCAAAVCSCYENPQTKGGTLCSLQRGCEEAKKARDAMATCLAQALKQQEAAEKEKAAAGKHVRDFSKRLDTMASELLPLAGDAADEERRAAQEAMQSLKEAATAAAEHLKRMQRLVQALQASERACSEVLQGEEQAAQNAEGSSAHAIALHGARLKVRDAAQLVLDQQGPAEERFSAILNQAQVRRPSSHLRRSCVCIVPCLLFGACCHWVT